jgi:hypothetical protein
MGKISNLMDDIEH